jgi:beta-glucosidase
MELPEATAEEARVRELLSRMTLGEKIGQLSQVNAPHEGEGIPPDFAEAVRRGWVSSILNGVDVEIVNEIQRIAVEESRLGIPLLVGRDVIHGFRTIFPIPLGQAATWSPEIVREGARISALEASTHGINWTFAPMVDIGRDPRWGRVAECLGEDPVLASRLAVAMVEGFQGENLSDHGSILACAKHFAGYGASEAGRDYNSTFIPEGELRDVHLPPFRAAVEAGVGTLMSSFSDLNGVPATGSRFLMTEVLREEWDFDGFVVSDWDSIHQMAVHGLTEGDHQSAEVAADAGIDMEMASRCYIDHLESLVEDGHVSIERVDEMVSNILRIKVRAGLFENPYRDPADYPEPGNDDHLNASYEAAVQSGVLLKNDGSRENRLLPLDLDRIDRIAVIGPLADEAKEQLGTWVFDGDPSLSVTPLQSLREAAEGRAEIEYVKALGKTYDRSEIHFDAACDAASRADVAVLFLGEDAILSGEAHCRSNIALPGAQEALLKAVSETGTPVVLVILAGRPLALESVAGYAQAILYMWHPGTMGGPAIRDLLAGARNPSGKLPVTLPRVTGQIPLYYAHRPTGRPPTPESFMYIDDIPADAHQVSIGNTSFHLDVWYRPLFSFGHGLSYTDFHYEHLGLDSDAVRLGDEVRVHVDVINTGDRGGHEIVQLYIRDQVASVTRPVRELKAFERVWLEPGERRTVEFTLTTRDLAFTGRDMRPTIEPGRFTVWVGRDSDTVRRAEFELLPVDSSTMNPSETVS